MLAGVVLCHESFGFGLDEAICERGSSLGAIESTQKGDRVVGEHCILPESRRVMRMTLPMGGDLAGKG